MSWRLWVYPDEDDARRLVLALTPEGGVPPGAPPFRLVDVPHLYLAPDRAHHLAAVLQAWAGARATHEAEAE